MNDTLLHDANKADRAEVEVNPILTRARSLAAAGISFIPVSADKRPVFDRLPAGIDGRPSWDDFKTSYPTADEADEWFGDGACRIALVHGAISRNLETVDFDRPDHYPAGLPRETLDAFLTQAEGLLPGISNRLSIIQTPKGFHVRYRCEGAVGGNVKLAEVPKLKDDGHPDVGMFDRPRKATQIETRGESGYAVSDPSPGYVHIAGPTIEQADPVTADERLALLTIARSFDRMPDEEDVEVQRPASGQDHGDELRPGDDLNARGDLWESMIDKAGLKKRYTANGTTYLQRIGSTNPVAATIREFSGQQKLTVFSTNVDLPTAKPLSLFAIYTCIEHQGDWIGAARALRELGYGSPPKSTQPRLTNVNGPLIDDAGELTVEITVPPQIVSIGYMVAKYPRLRPEVVGGLLRKGEVANVIAKSKVGKSWFGYGLGLSVATGRKWLGRFDCVQGKVLLIDNELHPEVIAHRISVVANVMGLRPEEYADRFDVLSLRGRLTPIGGLGTIIRNVERGYYSLIILDAMYRMLPDGSSENDNAAMAGVYNLVDQYAEATGAAFVLVHHATKGDQAGKDVTDVGAGAGAQSRAADTHLILRPHQEEDCAVLDAAVRSFAPINPVTVRWSYPLWTPDEDLDPKRLKRIPNKQQQLQQERDREGFSAIVNAIRELGPATLSKLENRTGISRDRLKRLLAVMRGDDRLTAKDDVIKGNPTTVYDLAEYLQNA